MSNGVLISRYAVWEKEPKIIDLQEYAKSKAGSVGGSGINKVKAINDFIKSNGRY